jgi:hypothetical protein
METNNNTNNTNNSNNSIYNDKMSVDINENNNSIIDDNGSMNHNSNNKCPPCPICESKNEEEKVEKIGFLQKFFSFGDKVEKGLQNTEDKVKNKMGYVKNNLNNMSSIIANPFKKVLNRGDADPNTTINSEQDGGKNRYHKRVTYKNANKKCNKKKNSKTNKNKNKKGIKKMKSTQKNKKIKFQRRK